MAHPLPIEIPERWYPSNKHFTPYKAAVAFLRERSSSVQRDRSSDLNTPILRELLDFILGIDALALDSESTERAKLLFLDAIGAGIASTSSPEASTVATAIRKSMGPGSTTVIGDTPASSVGASGINGYLITARSLCDIHRPTLCHVTPLVVPAALAAAEEMRVDGAAFLAGLIAGMEITVRIGYALDYEVFRRRGWHTPGVAGPFGAAAAVSRIWGLDSETTASALGIAGSQAGGTFASFGTPTIKFHQARAAMSGLLSARLAAEGLRGNPAILTADDGGILNTFSNGGDPGALVDQLGTTWRFSETETRRWPAAAALQGVIATLLAMPVADPDQVTSIEIGLPAASFAMNAEMSWEDTFHATLSARWISAVTLFDGDCWIEQTSPARLADAEVAAFARDRVAVFLDDDLPEGGCSVAMRLLDGTRTHGRWPQNDDREPVVRANWQSTEEKALRAARGVIPQDRTRRIVSMVRGLERLPDITELTTLLGRQSTSGAPCQ